MIELDAQMQQLYALVLVAIARADGEISLDEGLRLGNLIQKRAGIASLDDLLMEARPSPEHFAAQAMGDPFRGRSIHPIELATQLVLDALDIVLAKGHVTHAELSALRSFVAPLGIDDARLRAIAGKQAAWLPQ